MVEPATGLVRTIIAGLLVGAGSGMGNGCTSGHGISGLSRFSARSAVFTAAFMATGFLTATLFDTNTAVGIDSTKSAIASMTVPATDVLVGYFSIAAAAVAVFCGI